MTVLTKCRDRTLAGVVVVVGSVALVAGVLLPTAQAAYAADVVTDPGPVNTGYSVCALRTSDNQGDLDWRENSDHDLGLQGKLSCSYLLQGVRARIQFDRSAYAPTYSRWVRVGGESVTELREGAHKATIVYGISPSALGRTTGVSTLTPSGMSGSIGVEAASGLRNGLKVKVLNNASGQQWQLTDAGQLRVASNYAYCLDIEGGYANPGKLAHVWKCDGGASERWYSLRNGMIVSQQNTNYCLTVAFTGITGPIGPVPESTTPRQSVQPLTIITTELCDGRPGQVFTTP
jgi:hypothetical protein